MKSCLRKNRNFAHDNYQEGNGKISFRGGGFCAGQNAPRLIDATHKKKKNKVWPAYGIGSVPWIGYFFFLRRWFCPLQIARLISLARQMRRIKGNGDCAAGKNGQAYNT